MTYADNLKIYKAKCDMLSHSIRVYEEMGVAGGDEILDFILVFHELEIATGEYLDYFGYCVREYVNLDWEV